jgi:hypothetical protein
MAGLIKLPEAAEDPGFKEEAQRLANVLKPDASADGNRLRQFSPRVP